jgi:hypothetical protein
MCKILFFPNNRISSVAIGTNAVRITTSDALSRICPETQVYAGYKRHV